MERVIFRKNEQRQFIQSLCKKCSLRKFHIKNNIKIPYQTLKQYYSERLTLPLPVFDALCEIGEVEKSRFNYTIIDGNWGAVKGGKRGIRSLFRKYNMDVLNEWRSKGGRNSGAGGRHAKEISLPYKIDSNLAEIIGAHLGDGTLTKYFLRISGDKRYDVGYFCYLSSIIEKTFKIQPAIRADKDRNTLYLEIRSKKFCQFMHENFGLPYGDKIKGGAKIPEKILRNPTLTRACVRGLIDTDGSVCRRDNYICLVFNSHNVILRNQVWKICKDMNIFTHKFDDEVGTNSWSRILRYFSIVGSSNIRHIIRFRERYENNKFLHKGEITKYFNIYNDINLPYRVHGLVAKSHSR